MEKISELYSRYKDYIIFALLFIVFMLVSAIIFYYFQNSINALRKEIKDRPVVEVRNEKKESDKLIVDIKGEVKTPGVYFLDKGKRVIDVVNRAGGLTRKADTSANNLSMKVKDEMVIVIYSKDEIKNYIKTKEKEKVVQEKCQSEKVVNGSCIDSVNGESTDIKNNSTSSNKNSKTTAGDSTTNNNSEQPSGKVSLNTATKEQLMTLTGIGESKAEAIIEYRKNKPFETIEEIKEVSGIGDSLFEKIKDNITT